LFVVSDVHGHRAEWREALRAASLMDHAGGWCGGVARLWLLGDYVDRGPDGIGVIDDIRALSAGARAAGGEVRALLGNHEVQMLAAHRFGAVPVDGWDFHGRWARYGGRESDLRRLTPDHAAWLIGLPVVAVVGGHLLVHSDTVRYLDYGADVAAVNKAVAEVLRGGDGARWRELGSRMSDRGAFRDADPAHPDDPVSAMLRALGGSVLVHGHSTLTRQFGIAPAEVREALRYAAGRVLAVDGGLYEGGRILVTRLA
jgi:hypothetical protein